MKLFLILAVVIAAAVAAPATSDKDTIVLKQTSDVHAEGYTFAFETSDGVTREEEGHLKNVGTDEEAIQVRGTITWTAPDGQTFTLRYISDENGYQPEGEHLPTVAPKKIDA